ncbi:hypothetical protein PoB_000892900 [Plakobranchus ocellatus]|uniref:Uncharacterized protein n=1 Tax=Plakobranchus ocellatus TaxID=259542 RepID=A0AAV3YHE1_9GAST|nr:hypothetical protein PoB_000892900 [Plakobranchus ocellatus]
MIAQYDGALSFLDTKPGCSCRNGINRGANTSSIHRRSVRLLCTVMQAVLKFALMASQTITLPLPLLPTSLTQLFAKRSPYHRYTRSRPSPLSTKIEDSSDHKMFSHCRFVQRRCRKAHCNLVTAMHLCQSWSLKVFGS